MVENVKAPSSSVVVSGALQSRKVQLLPKSWQSFCRRALTARQKAPRLLSVITADVSAGDVEGTSKPHSEMHLSPQQYAQRQ